MRKTRIRRDCWARTDVRRCRDWQDGRWNDGSQVVSLTLRWVTTGLKPFRAKSEIDLPSQHHLSPSLLFPTGTCALLPPPGGGQDGTPQPHQLPLWPSESQASRHPFHHLWGSPVPLPLSTTSTLYFPLNPVRSPGGQGCLACPWHQALWALRACRQRDTRASRLNKQQVGPTHPWNPHCRWRWTWGGMSSQKRDTAQGSHLQTLRDTPWAVLTAVSDPSVSDFHPLF